MTQYECQNIEQISEDGYILDSYYPFAGTPLFDGVALSTNGSNAVEQWVYAGANDSFLRNNPPKPEFPTLPFLTNIFSESTPNGPLFNRLQFAVEAYDDGSNSETVTRITKTAGSIKKVTTNKYCQTTPPPRAP